MQLQIELDKLGIPSVGTVRPNRLKGCNFSTDKDMKKKGRGSFEELVYKKEGITLRAVKWYDNKPVHLLSSFVGTYPTSQVQRWDKAKKETILVECPNIVTFYNKCMGGVDLMDSLMALYRTKIRSKKWYLRIVFHIFFLAVVNAWLLYRRDTQLLGVRKDDELSLLDFKASIAACLCQEGKERLEKRGRPSLSIIEQEIEQKRKRGLIATLP
ncbi:piggyBac transposable element-derived protein 2-like [Diabrotica virgifera virgifera]|uniref:PiggyBac transposable element-derived protein domain-containing protein n=1 Tax=Diabrotica virgifera virgifera TaxID=50390 RepID=A0ABM5JY18_DIAVI|nr:piggyBac transposable element-derived protein 2-like [Diabrotica virgifera virgifera]